MRIFTFQEADLSRVMCHPCFVMNNRKIRRGKIRRIITNRCLPQQDTNNILKK